ncbi:hypothetical protein [Ruegeria faecimaris]|uniref:Uncharacterized protein n=1 Tax=Ruegeria faecimaris TaxID=686389 RepID=A0A521AIX3_9RHOB|nr:hypothetical protein [Ruegeria faecimaris]SMO34762.1 hypothetical protein SAMN06265380_101153 [Ruegeria faecimaris]
MKYLFLASIFTVFAQAAAAETITYDCAVRDRDGTGWVAPRYIFVIDKDGVSAQTASGHNEMQSAKLKIDRKKRYKLDWRVELTEFGGQKVRVNYTARIDPSDNTVKLRGNWVNANFVNKPSGQGKCKVIDG